jgi:hypothetical protein
MNDPLTTAIELERESHEHFNAKEFEKVLGCIVKIDAVGERSPSVSLLLARTLFHLNRAPEAAAIVAHLLESNPHDANYLISLSLYLRAVGDFDGSLQALREVTTDMPGYAFLRGWHLMREGKFLEGFTMLEREIGIWRAEAQYSLPQDKKFQKGMSLDGKSILLVLEGGYGDELAYVRFARILAARGARVKVAASARFVATLQRIEGVSEARVIKDFAPSDYDYYLPSMSIIPTLGIEDPSDTARFPYLSALPEHVAHLQSQIETQKGARPAIGIHWQGNWDFDYLECKSPPAADMLALAEVGTLFSFQRDAGKNILPTGAPVIDLESGMPSWERTIAGLSLMDYVVTNDTSTAHIAGALGKRTLVLLPLAPHHYWLPLSERSWWYPTMSTFRQPRYNDWRGAIEAARAHIQADLK